ncbi:MAG: hypothetical protein WD334_06875 [Chitinophagales bacterium]
MKTKILSLALTISFLLIQQNDLSAKEKSDIHQRIDIEQYIEYPDAARSDNLSDQVIVTFQVDSTGRVEINAVESQYEIFKMAIQQQMSNIILNQLDTNKLYNIIINFKLM